MITISEASTLVFVIEQRYQPLPTETIAPSPQLIET
jgi:hypothetical protein